MTTKQETLTDLMSSILDNSIEVVDLTHELHENTPCLKLPEPFVDTKGFTMEKISEYDDNGPFFYWNNITMGEHCGTHFDAPVHWITGKDHDYLDEIPVKNLIGEVCVIDIKDKSDKDPDYCFTVEDIKDYEAEYGKIPAHSWVVVHTGWAKFVNDERFLNEDKDGQPHTPGPSKEAVEFLANEREILGFGVETVGTDAGIAGTFDPPFPAHNLIHGAGKYGLASLNNIDKLPPRGAVMIASPLKIEKGSGSPARVIALVNKK